MESIMNELLVRARSETSDVKYIPSSTSLHCHGSFIAPEDLRAADYVTLSDSTNQSPSSAGTPIWAATSDVTSPSPCEGITPQSVDYSWLDSGDDQSDSDISMVSLSFDENNYSVLNLSSSPNHVTSPTPTYLHFESPKHDVYTPLQPTYTRSQFAFPSPPSVSLGDVTAEHDTGSTSDTAPCSFSIDAILDSTPHTANLSDTSAHVIGALFTCMDDGNTVHSPVSTDYYTGNGHYTSTPKSTTSSSSLSSRDTLFWCHACSDVCASREDAESHQFIHSVEDARCQLSGEMFNQHGYITCHEELRNFHRIKCGICEKIAADRFFPTHMRFHEEQIRGTYRRQSPSNAGNNSPKSRFHSPCASEKRYTQCSFCGLRCRSKHARTVHERSHMYRKPYVCATPGCGKSFGQNIHLRLHQRVHNNESCSS